jgi:Flp pilus assembly protein TadG
MPLRLPKSDRRKALWPARRARRKCKHSGHALVLLAILLPMLIGVIGLGLDGGLMMNDWRHLQSAVDAAATGAATDLRLGKAAGDAENTARDLIQNANEFATALVTVNIPPQEGEFSGVDGYVEVVATISHRPQFMPIVDNLMERPIVARAVAGVDDVTAGAAVVVLDPDPADLSIPPLPGLPAAPSILAGFEVEGLGRFSVEGAVLVNTTWGGVDENGDPVGASTSPPYAVTCMPLLPLTRLRARDIRVVGGVDNPTNYQSYPSGGGSPLQANRVPVPDPYAELPPPTTSSDPGHVSTVLRGGVTVVGLPLLGPPVTLRPGIYEHITVVSGVANFQPGIYIIRGVNPLTQMSLSLLAGSINASGVLFYITNTPSYDGASGVPDAGDGETAPLIAGPSLLVPSVFIQASLLGSGISGLNAAGSPFDGMVIYQRRVDRRPIVIAHQNLIGSAQFSGTVYSKWGHVIFAGNGTYNARFVCGTMRVVTLFDTTLEPTSLLPPAQDVLLVE